MVYEEYSYNDIQDYLFDKIDILITGEANEEERNHFLADEWRKQDKVVLSLKLEEGGYVLCKLLGKEDQLLKRVDICIGLPQLLRGMGISNMNVLLDLSGLTHVLIMFLTKQLIMYLSPRLLFAAYIRPERYKYESDDIGCQLCQKIGTVSTVPGFSKRETGKQTLCAFLGFEGVRLKGILEAVNSFDRLIPIVAFPSGTPQWYNITVRNSMDTLQSEGRNLSVYKCYSESIFGAIDLLEGIISPDESVVLAPLGTRPHSMACAIYACRNKMTKIVYDFAIESSHRAVGVADITIYHLSSFIAN